MKFQSIVYILKHINFKTLYFNLSYFPLSVAIRLPVFISKNVWFKKLKGKIILPDRVYPGIVKIGFGDIGIFDKKRSRSVLELNGQVYFKGTVTIGHGSKICVGRQGQLFLGENFVITAESEIICFHKISFGDGCLVSWDVLIMDSDFHKIFYSGEWINGDAEIEIEDNVWIGARTTILKGTRIAYGSVVAANSVVAKSLSTAKALYAGNPATLKKESIEWGV